MKSTERIGLTDDRYDIDLTPPPEKLTILEELAEWDVELKWREYETDEAEPGRAYGLWYLTNTYTENLFDDWAIGHLVDDPTEHLTSRDREGAAILINRELEAEDINLRREAWEPDLGCYHGDGLRHAGPSINVKLHGIWEMNRQVEKALDIEFEEVDIEGTIQWETVEWEMEWFKDTYLPDKYPDLDVDRLGLFGRSGGHLVYDVYSPDYDAWPLRLTEATQLRALFEEIPELVKGVEQQVTARLGSILVLQHWNLAVDEWRDGEEIAKTEALRTKDFVKATWHQENLDAEIEWFDISDGEELIWNIIYKEDT